MTGKISQSIFARVETIFLAIMLCAICPIFFFLAGWWGSYLLLPENQIPTYALGGLSLGIVLDILFLKKWMKTALRIHPVILVLIYLFYSVGIFGFFMGVPVFNVFMGAIAGFYLGRRLLHAKTALEETQKSIHRTSLFTAFVLAMACMAAFVLAASEPTLANNINSMLGDMFGMRTTFDNRTILILSAFMGVLLVIIEYYLTRAVAKMAYEG